MIRSRIGRIVRITIPVVLLVVVTSVVTLSAQGNPTLNDILARLDKIIAVLTPTPPPPAGPVTLGTSAVLASVGQNLYCNASNLGTETLSIEFRVVNVLADPVAEYVFSTAPSTTIWVVTPGVNGLFQRCEFTVHGSAAAVRANLTVVAPGFVTTVLEAR